MRQKFGRGAAFGVLALVLAGCAVGPAATPVAPAPADQSVPPRATSARLDLTADDRDVDKISARFAGSVTARYGARAAVESVTDDLKGQGFLCRDVPPVERRTDYLVAACELPKPHGLCSDLFVISLRYAGGGVTNGLFVRADGSFERSCPIKGTN